MIADTLIKPQNKSTNIISFVSLFLIFQRQDLEYREKVTSPKSYLTCTDVSGENRMVGFCEITLAYEEIGSGQLTQDGTGHPRTATRPNVVDWSGVLMS
jgi:hypothetical protein